MQRIMQPQALSYNQRKGDLFRSSAGVDSFVFIHLFFKKLVVVSSPSTILLHTHTWSLRKHLLGLASKHLLGTSTLVQSTTVLLEEMDD
jgi:hypothetical protein